MFKLSACSVLTLRSGDKLEDIRILSDKLLDCINLIKGKFNGVLVLAPTVYIHGPELPTRGFQLSSTRISTTFSDDLILTLLATLFSSLKVYDIIDKNR